MILISLAIVIAGLAALFLAADFAVLMPLAAHKAGQPEARVRTAGGRITPFHPQDVAKLRSGAVAIDPQHHVLKIRRALGAEFYLDFAAIERIGGDASGAVPHLILEYRSSERGKTRTLEILFHDLAQRDLWDAIISGAAASMAEAAGKAAAEQTASGKPAGAPAGAAANEA